MALSWNEIKDRALNFSKEWADTSIEEADSKTFLVEFFNVFGISSKRVGTFEHRVKKPAIPLVCNEGLVVSRL